MADCDYDAPAIVADRHWASLPQNDIVVVGKRLPSVLQCVGASAKKNGVAIALDVAGAVIPGASTAATLGKLGVGGAALVNSAAGGDLKGIGLGIADFHLSSAAPLVEQYKNISNVAKAIPFVGAIVSVTAAGFDAYSAYQDYQNCRAGK